jgi:predicted ABC-type transport system involved in lysophospholipase L1 biosynthesis ATPase subunit/predicted GNAT family acetyltransferase
VTDVIRAVSEDDWRTLRDVRLRALADAPTAFGTTSREAAEFTEERWRERARGSATSRQFLAFSAAEAIGIAGLFDDGGGCAQIVSVWVSPDHRGRGVARALTRAALDFAAAAGLARITLWVTEGNAPARGLYDGLGFRATGRRQPLPSALSGAERDRFLQVSVGWVFQTSGLLPLLSAQENVEVPLRLAGFTAADTEQRAAEVLAMVGLATRRSHTPAELSGGEQQRVALARALAKRPELVIADEPTAQLDSETAAGIMDLLRVVVGTGTAVLMATHDRLAMDYADRVVTMEDGRLAAAV